LLANVQGCGIGSIGCCGKRAGSRIDLTYNLVAPIIEAPGDGGVVGSNLFEEAKVLENLLRPRAQAPGTPCVIDCILVNNAASKTATSEVTSKG
jgi:hypothetical protein